MIVLPMRTGRGLNDREHPMARMRRVASEREMVAWCLALQRAIRPRLPCTVLLTRFAPSAGLDDDNLTGALKGVRDAIAAWLQVNDKDRKTVRYEYAQDRGDWAVGIEFKAAPLTHEPAPVAEAGEA